ncbi:MAG TPA: TetR/AcrR family transcriptional regulator [Streptosporangiaceae bacterium]|nr:TetR/AcrR family transcriptional regulator [Streptosporangiaceae bacterium]
MSETPGTPEPPPEPPWRTPPRRGRSAPRPQLSRDLIINAALKVIEADGGDALTMRRVADEIGVSASALYGYVANKEELVQLVLEQIIAEVPFPPAATTGADGQDDDWQDLVRNFGREMLGIFKRHPGVAGLTMGRVPFGPSMLQGSEYILGRLRAAGLPDQVVAFVGDLGGLYVGAIAYEREVTPIAEPADFAAQAAVWLKSLPKDQFPNTVELADLLVSGSAEDRFEWGLDVIIRGLASYLTSPPTAAAHWPQPSESSP